jgi:hypothetical protein
MADKTIGGEGIRQDWRIDIKATNEQKTTNDNNRIYEKNIRYFIGNFAADGGSADGTTCSLEWRR